MVIVFCILGQTLAVDGGRSLPIPYWWKAHTHKLFVWHNIWWNRYFNNICTALFWPTFVCLYAVIE